jgi:hypothetical protein
MSVNIYQSTRRKTTEGLNVHTMQRYEGLRTSVPLFFFENVNVSWVSKKCEKYLICKEKFGWLVGWLVSQPVSRLVNYPKINSYVSEFVFKFLCHRKTFSTLTCVLASFENLIF